MEYNTQEENANHEGPDSEEMGQYEVDEQQIESGSVTNIGNPNMIPAIKKRRSLIE